MACSAGFCQPCSGKQAFSGEGITPSCSRAALKARPRLSAALQVGASVRTATRAASRSGDFQSPIYLVGGFKPPLLDALSEFVL